MADKLSAQCCSLPPFTSEYTPTGTYLTIPVPDNQPDLPVYAVGPADATTALVCIYDIFALHQNTLQGADHLATTYGCRVLIPDIFRGDSWPVDNMPPKEGFEALTSWVQAHGQYEGLIQPALKALVSKLKADGVQKLGVSFFPF